MSRESPERTHESTVNKRTDGWATRIGVDSVCMVVGLDPQTCRHDGQQTARSVETATRAMPAGEKLSHPAKIDEATTILENKPPSSCLD